MEISSRVTMGEQKSPGLWPATMQVGKEAWVGKINHAGARKPKAAKKKKQLQTTKYSTIQMQGSGGASQLGGNKAGNLSCRHNTAESESESESESD